MTKPEGTAAQPSAGAFGSDLHSFIELYEQHYPEEVLHIEKPIKAEWEITALAMQLEKDHRFPILICHNVTVNGQKAEMPVVTFLMASRLRLARLLGEDVRKSGLACYERVQARIKPVVVSRQQAPVKETIEKGNEIDVRRLPAPLHHRMDPGRYITEGFFLTFNRNTGLDNSAMQRGWLAGKDEIRVWLAPSSHNAHNLREYEEAGEDMPAAYWVGHHPLVLLGGPGDRVGPSGKETGYLVGGRWNTQFVDELTPQEGDIVISRKHTHSAFYYTDLDFILKNLGIELVMYGGITTGVCVGSSIRDGFHSQFVAILLNDCCWEFTPELQAASEMIVKMHFGYVTNSEEVIKGLTATALT